MWVGAGVGPRDRQVVVRRGPIGYDSPMRSLSLQAASHEAALSMQKSSGALRYLGRMTLRKLCGVTVAALLIAACNGDSESPRGRSPLTGAENPDTEQPETERPDPEPSDATPPETVLVSGPVPLVASRTAHLAFSGSDSAGPVHFLCRIGAGAYLACESPVVLAGLADGAQSFSVKAVNAAGLEDPTPATHAWVVDATAPETTIDAGPSAETSALQATFTFSSVDDSADYFECSVDDGPFAGCGSPHTLTGLTEGDHTFAVRAVDAAGNVDATPAVRAWTVTLPAWAPNVLWTERLGQLVGTARSPYHPIGMKGTDLGVAFPLNGQLVILFGDSWTLDGMDWDVDSVALADPAYAGDGSLPLVSWLTQPGGRFLPLTVPGLPSGLHLGGMNVPVDGFANGATTFVFFSTGYSGNPAVHTHSILAHTTGFDFGTMALDHVEPSEKFININVIVEGETAWLFGSGPYRASPIYLARAPLATIADRGTWTYYQSGSGSMAVYGPGESSAAALVGTTDVGEFSVRKHPRLNLYLMAYQTGGAQRGVHLRTATHPAGPWSAPLRIWNPDVHGYTYFMHARADIVGYDDGLSEPGRENEWGGEYGPYFVPEWFDGPGTPEGAWSIVYTLSSWNPYTVHLIRTVLGPAGLASPQVRGAGLPWPTLANADFAGGLQDWSASGDTFRTFSRNGKQCVTTFTTEKGDAAVGRLWQDFTVNDTVSELRFQVHGGQAAVRLELGDDVLFATRGRNNNDVDTSVRWKLAEHRGKTVRLAIHDDLTGGWGFVSVCGFSFH